MFHVQEETREIDQRILRRDRGVGAGSEENSPHPPLTDPGPGAGRAKARPEPMHDDRNASR